MKPGDLCEFCRERDAYLFPSVDPDTGSFDKDAFTSEKGSRHDVGIVVAVFRESSIFVLMPTKFGWCRSQRLKVIG
jgi:hypothetical protein